MIQKLLSYVIDLLEDWEHRESLRTFGAARSSMWGYTRDEYEKLHPKICFCGTTKKIELHHIIPFHKDPTKERDFDNLIWLCRKHHYDFGHLKSWYSHNIDVRDDAALWKDKIENRP